MMTFHMSVCFQSWQLLGVGVVGDLISVSMSRVCAVLLLVAMNAIMILIRY